MALHDGAVAALAMLNLVVSIILFTWMAAGPMPTAVRRAAWLGIAPLWVGWLVFCLEGGWI